MKQIISIAIAIFLSSVALFADVTRTSLEQVTVFMDGARMEHSASLKIEKGLNKAILSGVADQISPNSINVSFGQEVTLVSIKQRREYLEETEEAPEVRKLRDSLEKLQYALRSLDDESGILRKEEELIMANKQIGGQNTGVSVAELQKMTDFVRSRLTAIRKDLLGIEIKMKELKELIGKITKQLSTMREESNIGKNRVIIEFLASSAGKMSVSLEYMTSSAGWGISYDVRSPGLEGKLSIEYKANIYQSSGIDWKDTKMIVSTRRAFMNTRIPEIRPIWLSFAEYRVSRADYVSQQNVRLYDKDKKLSQEKELSKFSGEVQVSGDRKYKPAIPMESAEAMTLTSEYHPAINYTIPSDGQAHLVILQREEVDAKYEYYTLPKYDMNAYLIAKVKDPRSLNLMPGPANIYFENSFVGTSSIDPFIADSEMVVSLGRDDRIAVTREAIDDYTEDFFFSSDIERKFGYLIKIRNNKEKKIKIVLEDQIPISKQEDIEVKLIKNDDAKWNKTYGFQTWELEIAPGETVERRIVFSVRHPKDKRVTNF